MRHKVGTKSFDQKLKMMDDIDSEFKELWKANKLIGVIAEEVFFPIIIDYKSPQVHMYNKIIHSNAISCMRLGKFLNCANFYSKENN